VNYETFLKDTEQTGFIFKDNIRFYKRIIQFFSGLEKIRSAEGQIESF